MILEMNAAASSNKQGIALDGAGICAKSNRQIHQIIGGAHICSHNPTVKGHRFQRRMLIFYMIPFLYKDIWYMWIACCWNHWSENKLGWFTDLQLPDSMLKIYKGWFWILYHPALLKYTSCQKHGSEKSVPPTAVTFEIRPVSTSMIFVLQRIHLKPKVASKTAQNFQVLKEVTSQDVKNSGW